jgi:hypothetical protein
MLTRYEEAHVTSPSTDVAGTMTRYAIEFMTAMGSGEPISRVDWFKIDGRESSCLITVVPG